MRTTCLSWQDIMTITIIMSSYTKRLASSFNLAFINARRTGLPTTSFLYSTKPPKVALNIYSRNHLNNQKRFNRHDPYAKTVLMMEADDDDDGEQSSSSSPNTTTLEQKEMWNIPELRKEASRLTLRCHKKIGKASTRLQRANEQVEEIRTCPNATLEQLEACPNVKLIEDEWNDLRSRLKGLNLLEEKLQSIKGGKNTQLPDDVLELVLSLEVNDQPPQRQVRPKKTKKKGPRSVAPRLPYFRYYSENNTEIRVGRRSEDNDELSCNPKHRDGPDWWMHASGCPGSHIVIRCHDAVLHKDVIMDAAALAAMQSKCQGNVIKVNLTRCRDVKKPYGAKPGLVQLVGKVETVSVNMKQAEARLARLNETRSRNND
mmetsp:Transcript_30349/g.34918  ORF Transcript_30349/g.34918 Transcript_30349/m.34918 type:complete len:374 (+) Transcript_30349:237-1358(+)